ncbi:MAG: hypothetical protein MRECE_22c029, partial [Mycoplasmataceae bacterium CE_OT135]
LQNEKTNLSNQINASQEKTQKLSQEKEELTTQNQTLANDFNSLKRTNEEEKNTLNQQIISLEETRISIEKEFNQQVNELKQKTEKLTTDLAKERLISRQKQTELNNLLQSANFFSAFLKNYESKK